MKKTMDALTARKSRGDDILERRRQLEQFKRRLLTLPSRLSMMIGQSVAGLIPGYMFSLPSPSRPAPGFVRQGSHTKVGPGRDLAWRKLNSLRTVAHKTNGVPRHARSIELTDEQRFALGYMHASGERHRYLESVAARNGQAFADNLSAEVRQ